MMLMMLMLPLLVVYSTFNAPPTVQKATLGGVVRLSFLGERGLSGTMASNHSSTCGKRPVF